MKIHKLSLLSQITAALREQNRMVVHAHGCFDLLHLGHIRHLRAAKRLGDVLVVTITPDQFVNKGPKRPLFAADLRAEALAALETVDYVAINEWPTASPTIQLLKPNIYVKGPECVNVKSVGLLDEADAIRMVGGTLCFTNDPVFSSTALIAALEGA